MCGPIRTFFKVGNGLFTMEEVGCTVTVYDCGAQNTRLAESVAELITQGILEEDIEIDALFISHYDADHVNGLKELLASRLVKEVFLPHISPAYRYLCYRYCNNLRNVDKQFYQDPERYIKGISKNTTTVSFVDYYRGDAIPIPEPGHRRDAGTNKGISKVNSYILRNNAYPNWYYILYNRYVMDKKDEEDFLTKLGLDANASFSDIADKYDSSKSTELKKVLKEVAPSIITNHLNDYCMTLWSGCPNEKNACLYLGDYNAIDHYEDIKKVYSNFLPDVSILQIPHHGSSKNYNPQLLTSICKDAVCIVSAKKPPYNSRKHVDPSSVIQEITKEGMVVYPTMYHDIVMVDSPYRMPYHYYRYFYDYLHRYCRTLTLIRRE